MIVAEKVSTLHALLPGAKINSKNRKISVNVGISSETLVFNIGGVKFETFRSTLYKQPNNSLANKEFMQKHYRPGSNDYFFDRDPETFKVVLNYLRTGELHLPSSICGPAVKNELEFWGISDDIIERCCYSHYNSYNETLEALNQLERDTKGSLFLTPEESQSRDSSKLARFRTSMSIILNKPDSSLLAKIYGVISLLAVAVSILSFLAETHPSFLVQQNVTDVTDVFNLTRNVSEKVERKRTVMVPDSAFYDIDLACMIYFTLEYILRVFAARTRIRYIRSLSGAIDLVALLPDYLQLIMISADPNLMHGETTKIITILKVTRILRIFRLIRHVPGLWILIYTLKASIKELLLMTAFLVVGMLIFSSLIYYAEDRKTFTSIPHSFWWALVTMTTVGYGDMYPVTAWGYVIGSFTALSGLLMIGFSVPILVNNFMMYYKHVEFALEHEKMQRNKNCKDQDLKRQVYTEKHSPRNCVSENNNTAPEMITFDIGEKP